MRKSGKNSLIGYLLSAMLLMFLSVAFLAPTQSFAGGKHDDDDDTFSVPPCTYPAKSGRTIVNIPHQKLNSNNLSVGPLAVSIPAGTYNVYLVSWDGYHDRDEDDENDEQWYATLSDNAGNIVNTQVTTDLPDGVEVALRSELVNSNLSVSRAATYLTAKHAKLYGAYSADPLYAVCAVFDVVSTAPPAGGPPLLKQCNDGLDNDNDGKTDAADPACHADGNPNNPGSYDPAINNENQKPTIALIGSAAIQVLQGSVFTDPGAQALDPEDGTITGSIVKGGSVNTSVLGIYTLIYNVSDSKGLAADQKTRTVTVVAPTSTPTPTPTPTPPPAPGPTSAVCNDGLDNDNDGKTDAADPACHTDENASNASSYDGTRNSENSKPIITRLGNNPVTMFKGASYTDAGATALDPEDGNITAQVVRGGAVVTHATSPGNYTITYDVLDSKGLAAAQVTRLVIVQDEPGSSCSNCGGGITIDPLYITNEKIYTFPSPSGMAFMVTWDTNVSATSQVAYGKTSLQKLDLNSTLGYERATDLSTTTPLTKSHSVLVEGVEQGAIYYARPFSMQDYGSRERTVGIELSTKNASVSAPTVTSPSVGNVPPPSAAVRGDCFEYLREYIKFGVDNNRVEVLKLQSFLRTFEGFTSVPLSGIYDEATRDAVSMFQDRYADQVLTPWGLSTHTGYVYITTKRYINRRYCDYKKEFPLTPTQLGEIEGYRNSIEDARAAGIDVSAPGSPIDTTSVGSAKPVKDKAWDTPGGKLAQKPGGQKETSGTGGQSEDKATAAVIEAFDKMLEEKKNEETAQNADREDDVKNSPLNKLANAISAKIELEKLGQILLIVALFIIGFLLYRSGKNEDDTDGDGNNKADEPMPVKPKLNIPLDQPQKKDGEKRSAIHDNFPVRESERPHDDRRPHDGVPRKSGSFPQPQGTQQPKQESRVTLDQLKDNLVLKQDTHGPEKMGNDSVIHL